MIATQVSAFGEVLLYIIGSALFVMLTYFGSWLFRPDRPNEEKNTTYESGEDTVGSAWGQFNMRFYIIALLFILFEVEIVFLFPWATVFGDKNLIAETNGLWGWFAITEMMLFIFILALGLAYVWGKGFLDWEKPEVKLPKANSRVPEEMYERLNDQY
ncbi:NADH-quinone oxidoreductase subunit A [Persicobacter psychrovividus]|uniref:NADH-quinone oxidoreductase subunit A n=1 Tax=Persicobacter psychrovividus TaxID=387638 RepID=A0ABM7VHE7_9BACT|nr:NADH-quinone oxidoreductase subunit A [Persicobacter psychrovividus]